MTPALVAALLPVASFSSIPRSRASVPDATIARFRALSVARAIVREEGLMALTSGMGARVLFHIPAAAICWTTYEAAKRTFGCGDDDDDGGGFGPHHH